LPELRRETSQLAWAARLRKPPRDEVEFEISDFDSLTDEDHPARMISAYFARLDFSAIEVSVEAREATAGAARTSPHLLLALRLYATGDGVGSMRERARLCAQMPPIVVVRRQASFDLRAAGHKEAIEMQGFRDGAFAARFSNRRSTVRPLRVHSKQTSLAATVLRAQRPWFDAATDISNRKSLLPPHRPGVRANLWRGPSHLIAVLADA
jgi:hypothetical protein